MAVMDVMMQVRQERGRHVMWHPPEDSRPVLYCVVDSNYFGVRARDIAAQLE